MPTWRVKLDTGSVCEITATSLEFDYGALTFSDESGPVAIFSARSWLMVSRADAQLLWQPPPPESPRARIPSA